MICDCGTKALFFEKFTNDGIFIIFRCDAQESKKKGKCNFFYTEKIKDIKDINVASIINVQNNNPYHETMPSGLNETEIYTRELFHYIKLFKNVKHLQKTYSYGYTSNINYILKRLNMPLYFEKDETIESLEKRVNMNVYVKHVKQNSVYPIKLIDYPLEIAAPIDAKKNKNKNRKTKIASRLDTPNIKSFIEKEGKTKPSDIIDNKLVCGDSESDLSEDEDKDDEDEDKDEDEDNEDEDNTFDIDKCDSDQEDRDDTEAFSD